MLLRIMEDFDPETKLRIIVSNFEMGVFQTAIHQCTMDNPFKKSMLNLLCLGSVLMPALILNVYHLKVISFLIPPPQAGLI